MFGNLFKKKAAPRWNDLSQEQKNAVTMKLMKNISAMVGARYKIVSGFD